MVSSILVWRQPVVVFTGHVSLFRRKRLEYPRNRSGTRLIDVANTRPRVGGTFSRPFKWNPLNSIMKSTVTWPSDSNPLTSIINHGVFCRMGMHRGIALLVLDASVMRRRERDGEPAWKKDVCFTRDANFCASRCHCLLRLCKTQSSRLRSCRPRPLISEPFFFAGRFN